MSLTFAYIKLREYLLALKRDKESYRAEDGSQAEMDRTGRVVQTAENIPTEIDPVARVKFLFNDNAVAYSYWRSQELTLFWRALPNFQRPVLDFGCGDGSFSKCLLENIDHGVDIDPSALEIAAAYGIYRDLITFDQMVSDLPSASVGTVYSCSVLEHTIDIEACLSQIARVMRPGGKLYFSVPSPHFTQHMADLAGREFASNMNRRMFHRNMFDRKRWEALLEGVGLRVSEVLEFQPKSFTRKYFRISLLGNRTVGRIPGFRSWFWRRYKNQLVEDVACSISGEIDEGANYFIVAEKP